MVLLESILMVFLKVIIAVFCFASGAAMEFNLREVPKRSQKAAAVIFMLLIAFIVICVFFAIFSAT